MPGDECCYLCNECPNSYATLEELEKHMSSTHVLAPKNWDVKEEEEVMEEEPNSQVSDTR